MVVGVVNDSGRTSSAAVTGSYDWQFNPANARLSINLMIKNEKNKKTETREKKTIKSVILIGTTLGYY